MAEYGEEGNIKQQADMQRAKPDAPRPRDRDTDETQEVGVLRNILTEIEDVGINTGTLDATLKDARTVLAQVLTDGFLNLSESIKGMAQGVAQKSSLKELEDKKEDRAQVEETNSLLRKILNAGQTDLPVVKQGFFSIILGVFGGLAGLALGLVRGLIPGIIDSFLKSPTLNFLFKTLAKGLFAPIKFAFDRLPLRAQFILGVAVDLITKKIKKLVSNTITFFNKSFALVRNFIRTLFGFPAKQLSLFKEGGVSARILKVTKAASGLFAGILGFLMTPFRAVYDLIGNLTKPIKSIIEAFVGKQKGPGMVKGFAATAAKLFNPFFTMFDTAFQAFKAFGTTVGRLFFPLTVLLGVIDGVRGAVAGVTDTAENESKLIGGLFGALKGILVGFVAIPLDLLKSGVSFIFKKLFGADNFITKALDNFSFKDDLIVPIMDFITGIFQSIYGFLVSLPGRIANIPELIGNLFNNFLDMMRTGGSAAIEKVFNLPQQIAAAGSKIKDFFIRLIRNFLPDPKADALSLEGFASKLIPDGIYEKVGLDPNTGELLPVSVLPDTPEVVDDQALVTRGTRKQQDITANSVVDASVTRATSQVVNIVQGNSSNTANTLKDSFG